MKPQWRNISNSIDYIFLDPFYIIMSKGYIILRYKVILTMLITAIHFICSQDNDFSRRDALIGTFKNAEKLAKYEERLTFLCECCRSDIYPKFIHSLKAQP